jgi:hypothetical protein
MEINYILTRLRGLPVYWAINSGTLHITEGVSNYICLGTCCDSGNEFKQVIEDAKALGAERISSKNCYALDSRMTVGLYGLPFEETCQAKE